MENERAGVDAPATSEAGEDDLRDGRRLVLALGVLLLLVVGYFAFGMPGMDHGSAPADPAGEDHDGMDMGEDR